MQVLDWWDLLSAEPREPVRATPLPE